MRYLLVCLTLLAPHALTSAFEAENWPQLRGPHGTGATEGRNLPTQIDPATNVVWNVALPGRSAATPAVWEDRIFVSSPDGEDLYLIAFDTQGNQLWRRLIGTGNRLLGFNKRNNFATPSPVTDGSHVWLLVGSGDLACFDFEGNPIWARNLFDDFEPCKTLVGFGIGFSPLLYRDALYIPYLHQGTSFLLALDKATGAEKWKTPRTTAAELESKDAYSTPCVFEYDDRAEIIICGADLATAYDSETGQETWRHGEINPTDNKTLRIVVSPVTDQQRIYVSSAKRGPVHAIRAGGRGDVTESHRLWTWTENTPDVPTPAISEGLAYLLRENGVLSVLDTETGREHYRERIAREASPFFASPTVADGKVYMASERGLLVVVRAGPRFEKLAENDLDDLILASPVIVDDRIYIRTGGHLYCFAQSGT